jgi:hypothetical protein
MVHCSWFKVHFLQLAKHLQQTAVIPGIVSYGWQTPTPHLSFRRRDVVTGPRLYRIPPRNPPSVRHPWANRRETHRPDSPDSSCIIESVSINVTDFSVPDGVLVDDDVLKSYLTERNSANTVEQAYPD